MSNFQKFIWLFSNENANVLRVFAQFERDRNCYQESEYLELTISSWKVGFLAYIVVCSRAAWVSMWLGGLATG